MYLDIVKKNMGIRNQCLGPNACRDEEAYRFKEIDDDFRPPFFRDIDKIVYSLSYTRYMDKTQVFTFNDNDNISKRMTHVQMVSKIARTLGRALALNEDLIEAAALGHDLGHVPFGHIGERILNEISLRYGEGYFNHNIQSVRTLMFVENNGRGSNICLQVLDSIMCHNGELELIEYRPKEKTKEEFLGEYAKSYTEDGFVKKLVPMTLEGCVVRVSDIIAYIGRDIEDAIRLGIINVSDIPREITDVLGVKNSQIINTINHDILKNSIDKDYICMSPEVFDAVKKLKKFNQENIYAKANSMQDIRFYEEVFNKVFDACLSFIRNKKEDTNIFKQFLEGMDPEYLENTTDERKVLDYIAGMTDDYILKEYNSLSE